MIKRLKIRLILLVLSGLLLASAGLVAAINWINWQDLLQQANGVLTMLEATGGLRPMPTDAGWPDMPDMQGKGIREERDGKFTLRRRNDDTVRQAVNLSNFYTVQLDEQGQIIAWNSDRTELYEESDINALVSGALQEGRGSGRVGTQFYRLIRQEKGMLLIVLDATLEMQSARRVLRLTVLLALAEDVLLSLGAVWLIRRMVRPVDEALEKQKQFIWDASHELKTPLAVISANAEALAGEAGDSKPLEYIRSEVQRTDRLLQSLLTLARMEKGTAQNPQRLFDLSRALLSVALPFEATVFEAGKQLDVRIPNGVTCTGDEEMIRQLCVILLSNAEKYSDEKGKITLSLETRGEKRVIRVHNTGPAIPQEAQRRIFDRFYRVDSSHNRDIPGNGLGLSIAQSIVNAHKGKITVRSTLEEGTAFTVVL